MQDTPTQKWYLEKHQAGSKALRRIEIDGSSFRIGREGQDLELSLHETGVSRLHAELLIDSHGLSIHDCGSTNGTFVNRVRIDGDVALRMGDIIHVGEVEFRVGVDEAVGDSEWLGETLQIDLELSKQFTGGTRELMELLDRKAIVAALQPIVEAQSGTLHGYELLGRGSHPGLPANPGPLFAIANGLGACGRLSEIFRNEGLRQAVAHGHAERMFLNVHPDELGDEPRLTDQLRSLRSENPTLEMTIEIHEGTVVDLQAMARIREVLEQCDMELAYDDFGVGQSRFMELVEVPPDYIKLDRALITGLDRPTSRQSGLVEMVLKLAQDFKIRTLAEGVATEAEAVACRELGFDYLQGFHLGRPGPVGE